MSSENISKQQRISFSYCISCPNLPVKSVPSASPTKKTQPRPSDETSLPKLSLSSSLKNLHNGNQSPPPSARLRHSTANPPFIPFLRPSTSLGTLHSNRRSHSLRLNSPHSLQRLHVYNALTRRQRRRLHRCINQSAPRRSVQSSTLSSSDSTAGFGAT
jgi:hypothetical protein